jgi:hypothetical protein
MKGKHKKLEVLPSVENNRGPRNPLVFVLQEGTIFYARSKQSQA